jgi:hypothetical protein
VLALCEILLASLERGFDELESVDLRDGIELTLSMCVC